MFKGGCKVETNINMNIVKEIYWFRAVAKVINNTTALGNQPLQTCKGKENNARKNDNTSITPVITQRLTVGVRPYPKDIYILLPGRSP